MYDYENYIATWVARNNNTGHRIIVSNEQAMAKNRTFEPETIYLIVKQLTSTLSFGTQITPVQIICICEENDTEAGRTILNGISALNFNTHTEGTTFIKEEYSSPVVLSNFNDIGAGYRSVLYVSGTLYIMENVADITNVEIDDVAVSVVNFSLSYNMSPNTQQKANEYIASSVKSTASMSITFSVPMQSTTLINKIIGIINETSQTGTGNEDFKIEFNIGATNVIKYMKLINAQIITAPNSVPSIQLGFMR